MSAVTDKRYALVLSGGGVRATAFHLGVILRLAGWGLIEDGSTHAPAKERFDRLQGLVRGDGRPALFDSRD